MAEVGPVFPVTLVEQVRRGPLWNRRFTEERTTYNEPKELASDLEIFDSRTKQGDYLIDANGIEWDFAVNWLTLETPLAEFFRRGESTE